MNKIIALISKEFILNKIDLIELNDLLKKCKMENLTKEELIDSIDNELRGLTKKQLKKIEKLTSKYGRKKLNKILSEDEKKVLNTPTDKF